MERKWVHCGEDFIGIHSNFEGENLRSRARDVSWPDFNSCRRQWRVENEEKYGNDKVMA